MTQVIYKIINLVNDKFYVGSTNNKKVRFRQHRRFLRQNRHHCKHLQAAWNLYGEVKFEFEVVEVVPEEENLFAAEQRWLDVHFGKPECYNSGAAAAAPWRGIYGADHPNHGKPLSDATKAALSAATKKQWSIGDPRTGTTHSEETRASISAKVRAAVAEGRGGKFIPSEETRRKMSEALKGNQCAKGHIRTEEHRRNLSIANTGNQNWLGKKHSEESKLKMSKQVLETTTGMQFPSLTAVLQYYDMKMPTLRRVLLTGKPISKGQFMGLVFRYIDQPPIT
jgi:group I intron endonuclease